MALELDGPRWPTFGGVRALAKAGVWKWAVLVWVLRGILGTFLDLLPSGNLVKFLHVSNFEVLDETEIMLSPNTLLMIVFLMTKKYLVQNLSSMK